MKKDNGNNPAYPVHGGAGDDSRNHTLGGGLTKREAFAMAAMQGLIPSYQTYEDGYGNAMSSLCGDAIAFADELLKQLES